MGHGFLKPPQCRPHQNEARHKSGPSPKAATTDSGDGDSNSFVAFSESSNRYRSGIYESFDTTAPQVLSVHKVESAVSVHRAERLRTHGPHVCSPTKRHSIRITPSACRIERNRRRA